MKLKLIENVESKWDLFHFLVECPTCGDRGGHAGLYNHPINPSLPGIFGYCVICEVSFRDNDNYNEVKHELKKMGFSPSHIHSINPSAKINRKAVHKTARVYTGLLKKYNPFYVTETKKALKDRGYEDSFIEYLMYHRHVTYARGVSIADQKKDWIAVNGASSVSYTKSCRNYDQEIKDLSPEERRKIKSFIRLSYLKAPYSDGLVIPVYYKQEMVSFQQRLVTKEGKKIYIPLSFKQQELLERERGMKQMPRLTHVDALVDPEYVYCNGEQPALNTDEKVIYVTEGALKAEVVNYYFKRECVAGLSAGALKSDGLKALLREYRDYKIIICPDKDYKYNYSVANSYLQLMDFLYAEDFNFTVLTWSHPDEIIDSSLKGIDDAILYQNADNKVGFYEVNPQAFFFNMDKDLKKKHTKMKGVDSVKVGALITESMVDALSYKVVKEDKKVINDPDFVYKTEDRVEAFETSLAKHKFCIDLSATGSGKSHGAGLLKIDRLSKAFIKERVTSKYKKNGSQINMFGGVEDKTDEDKMIDNLLKQNTVKCIKYVSQSPMNSTVQSLEGHRVIMGRTAKGWVYDTYLDKWRKAENNEEAIYQPNCPQADDVILLSQNRQILNIQKDICEKCPMKNGCLYLSDADKSKNTPYQKLSIQSLKVNEGDFIILDDPGSIEFFRSLAITEDDINKLVDMLGVKGKWKRHKVGIQTLLNLIFDEIKKGKSLISVVSELDRSKKLEQFRIGDWLSLPEPDKIPTATIRVRHDIGLELEGRYRTFKDLKRWFFMFLEVILGKQNGDIFYDFKNSQWVIKSVDPKFKDMLDKAAGILLLDATANKEYYRNIFGEEPFLMSAEGDPFKNVNVVRVEGFNNTYSSYLKYEHKRDELKAKIEWVNQKHEQNGTPSGVLTFSDVIKSPDFKPLWHPELQKGYWFCDERASNMFYLNNCASMFLIGIPNPNISSVAADAGSLQRDEGTCYVARPYGTVTENGEKVFIISKESADAKIRNAVAFKKDSAYIQALGRLRSLQRPNEKLTLYILEKTALPFEVQETIVVDETKKKEILSNSSDSVNIRVKYYNYLINEVKSIQTENGDDLDMKGFRMLDNKISDKVLFKLGVSAYNCRTCSDIIEKIGEVRDRFIKNPSMFIDLTKSGLTLDDITPEEKARQIKTSKLARK